MSENNSVQISIRVDKKLKSDAEALFDEIGLTMTTAINIFLKQCVYERQLPFYITRSGGNKTDGDISIFEDAGIKDNKV